MSLLSKMPFLFIYFSIKFEFSKRNFRFRKMAPKYKADPLFKFYFIFLGQKDQHTHKKRRINTKWHKTHSKVKSAQRKQLRS